jgi:hypothetical protein
MFSKWRGWLETMAHHVYDLHHNRFMWRAMSDAIATRAADSPDTFLAHYTKLYVDSSVMGVRRLADGSEQSASLARLIAKMLQHRDVVTEVRYIAAMPEDDRKWAKRSWALGGWADETGRVAVEVLERDQRELANQVRSVVAFADRLVAHIDARGLRDLPTFDDLDAAINGVGSLFKRYCHMLSVGVGSLTPTIQDDWKATFRRPLFEPIARRSPA